VPANVACLSDRLTSDHIAAELIDQEDVDDVDDVDD
jgi:hypothetical protein